MSKTKQLFLLIFVLLIAAFAFIFIFLLTQSEKPGPPRVPTGGLELLLSEAPVSTPAFAALAVIAFSVLAYAALPGFFPKAAKKKTKKGARGE